MDPNHHFKNPDAEAVEGNWKLFKGYLREKWGELTDDELDKTEGRREQLLGYLQSRDARERAELERELDEVADRADYAW